MEYYFIVVEGRHDEAMLAKMLKIMKYKEIINIEDIDIFWQGLIPKFFPYRNKINERVPVPSMFSKDNKSIAVYVAEGQDQLVKSISLNIANTIDPDELSGLAIICDADESIPLSKFSWLRDTLVNGTEIWLKDQFLEVLEPGKLYDNKPIKGIFVLPDNTKIGTLEKLILEGAQTSYIDIYKQANAYLNQIPQEYIAKWNVSKREKALVGIIGNVILPGGSNQVIIKDSRSNLITEQTIEQTSQKYLYAFITNLLA